MSFAKFGFKICLPWPSALFFWMFGGPRVSLTFQWTLSCLVVVSFPPMRFWPQEIAEVTDMDMLQSPMPTSSIPRPSLRPWFSHDFEKCGYYQQSSPFSTGIWEAVLSVHAVQATRPLFAGASSTTFGFNPRMAWMIRFCRAGRQTSKLNVSI